MARNPNAVAALLSSQAAIAVQQLVAHYLSAAVGPFWQQEIVAVAATVILYVGRHGIKAALLKAFATVKSLWAPPTAGTSSAG